MFTIAFVFVCSLLGCHASGGDSHEERTLTKPLAAMLMAADPAAAWQVAGAGHARSAGAKAAGNRQVPLLRPLLRSPRRHRDVLAQQDGTPGLPVNPILAEIEKEELDGVDEYMISNFDVTNLKIGSDEEKADKAVRSRGFASHDDNEMYKNVSEARRALMTGDFFKGAYDEEKIRFQEVDAKPVTQAPSGSLTGGHFDDAILGALSAMPKEALVDFLRRLASRRRDEVAAALQLVPKESVKIDAVERDANWAADKAEFERVMAANPEVSEYANVSRAFSATSAEFYDQKSEERRVRIEEARANFDEVYVQNQDREEDMANKDRMPAFNDKTWGSTDERRNARTAETLGTRDYFDWDHLDRDENEIMNDGYSDGVFKAPEVELDEDGLPITNVERSRGFSADAADTARSGAVNKARGSAGSAFEVYRQYSDPLPEKGVISIEEDDKKTGKGEQVFDFDHAMQKLNNLKETMDQEEWDYIFSDEDMSW